MIPKVKTWQVKYWTMQDSRWYGRVLTSRVQTINKRFAKMMANEALGYPAIHSHKITVGVISDKPRGPRGIYRKSWLGPIPKKPLSLRAAIDAYKALKDKPYTSASGSFE